MNSDFSVDIDPKVFNDAYRPHLTNLARVQIFFGGSSSGKSVFLAQRCVMNLLRGKRNYLICRQVARTLRMSVFAEVCSVISTWGVGGLFSINKSEMLITCTNGRQAAFVGLDDVEKLKSIRPAIGAWTDIWIEEATETELSAVKQLMKRQRGGSAKTKKRLILSFNPILKSHWIYETYFKTIGWAESQKEFRSDELFILKTTYKDNRFLTPDDVKDLENEPDRYYFEVYTLGNWGILGHVIFRNWRVEDLSEMQAQWTNRRHGLDFGFSSDPAALAVTHYDTKKKTIYVYDELYETELTNDILAERIKEKVKFDLVRCDSAEPKSIAELRKYKVNAVGARKGKDSVLFGIQWLKQQTIVIDKRCINMQNELSTYHYKEDAGGNALPIPIDKNNHLIDGLRYGYEDESGMKMSISPNASTTNYAR